MCENALKIMHMYIYMYMYTYINTHICIYIYISYTHYFMVQQCLRTCFKSLTTNIPSWTAYNAARFGLMSTGHRIVGVLGIPCIPAPVYRQYPEQRSPGSNTASCSMDHVLPWKLIWTPPPPQKKNLVFSSCFPFLRGIFWGSMSFFGGCTIPYRIGFEGFEDTLPAKVISICSEKSCLPATWSEGSTISPC